METVHQQLDADDDGGEEGLSTAEALLRLHADIAAELALERRRRGGWLHAARHRWRTSGARDWSAWPAAALSALVAAVLIASAALGGGAGDAVAGLLVLALVAADVALAVWQQTLADGELAGKAGRLADHLRRLAEAAGGGGWRAADYPHRHAPPSPCVSLQWTYRDGRLANLPASLLARGDVVLLGPGEAAMADMETARGEPAFRLARLDAYTPAAAAPRAQEKPAQPRLVAALPNRTFRVLASPYLEALRLTLRDGGGRPAPALHRQLRRLLTTVLLAAAATALLAAATAAVLQRWLLPAVQAPARLLLQRLCGGLLPALPLVCSLLLVPAAWLAQARLVALAGEMLQPRPEHARHLDMLDEASVSEHVSACWRHVWPALAATACGRDDSLPHTASLLFTLGTLSSLCCVDKKGVLSWPNPTAEKVVTVRLKARAERDARCSDGASVGSDAAEPDPDPATADAALEVLDLTRDNPAEPWDVQFDDPAWRDSLARLKPIGLSVLVNTCNDSTLDDYWRFCRHLACLAQGDADLVPVPARRCLCQLARQIGFSAHAADAFRLDAQVACYKHLTLDPARRDKLTRAFSFGRIRFPYPHMASVVLRELYTGSLQLVSQGTADLVLDSCSDFWDGCDVVPLSEADRRRVLDFYHRHSLTMYCSAFAYRPLTTKVAAELSDRYLELPAESGHIYRSVRSPAPPVHVVGAEPWERPVHPHYLSTDSLYGSEVDEVASTEGLLQVQCNQIFTGMVTLQYQALADMVRLIDQLEKACIRFVHFSKENELRSRVFSEKMGLESGWNCHISLLDDGGSQPSLAAEAEAAARRPLSDCEARACRQLERLRPLSVSAPSVVRLDVGPSSGGECGGSESDGEAARVPVPASQCLLTAEPPSRSPSHGTVSSDQSGPVNFDMSNRAKLPKGIAQIRPHLEHVDNVPLQVSLFTDCTPHTTRAMLRVMQDYGEVVCVLGSSGNAQNAAVFLQADAALAVRPLHPQLCSRRPPQLACNGGDDGDGDDVAPAVDAAGDDGRPLLGGLGDGPVSLAERLDALPCAFALRRDEGVSLTQLVLEARHRVLWLRVAVAFWACQAATLSAVAVFCALLLLPPPLPAVHTLWFAWVLVPLLSAALLAAPVDPRIMEEAQDRCPAHFTWPQLVYVAWCYGLRVLPPAVFATAFFGLSLRAACAPPSCQYVYPAGDLRPVQNALLLLLVLYACVTAASFVHRRAQLWQRAPCAGRAWNMAAAGALLAAVMFVLADCAAAGAWPRWPAAASAQLAAAALAGPPLQLAVNELVKRAEVKHNIRHQKRARLEFDTKLGMNSPF